MQQGETECDKLNLFYAHAFFNEYNFAHLQRNEIGRICDEKEKLSGPRDGRHSFVPAPPIKRVTLEIAVHVKYPVGYCHKFRIGVCHEGS